jgi:hypothetical protein
MPQKHLQKFSMAQEMVLSAILQTTCLSPFVISRLSITKLESNIQKKEYFKPQPKNNVSLIKKRFLIFKQTTQHMLNAWGSRQKES